MLLIAAVCMPHVHASAVKAVLAGDVLPEGRAYLVALYRKSTSHPFSSRRCSSHTHWPVWRWTCTQTPSQHSVVRQMEDSDAGHAYGPRGVCRGRETHNFAHAWNFGGVVMAYAVSYCVRGSEVVLHASAACCWCAGAEGRRCGEAEAFRDVGK